MPRGLAWVGVVGPGVIVLGASIGSGEFLLGPAVFVQHGLTLLWVTAVAIFLQTDLQHRGDALHARDRRAGVHRLHAHAAVAHALGVVLRRCSTSCRCGWPAWAATAAGAIFFLFAGRLAGPADADDGLPDRRRDVPALRRAAARRPTHRAHARAAQLGAGRGDPRRASSCSRCCFVPGRTWLAAAAGFAGFDPARRHFAFMPAGADFFLLARARRVLRLPAASRNLTLANWARDKGYGMSQHAGYIPAAIGGEQVNLAHSGFTFAPDAESMARWRGWWRIVRADQWGVFFVGRAARHDAAGAALRRRSCPRGSDIRGLGISAALARRASGERAGPPPAVSSRSSAPGCCSRRSSTWWRA